jgi:hypothetical protein
MFQRAGDVSANDAELSKPWCFRDVETAVKTIVTTHQVLYTTLGSRPSALGASSMVWIKISH